MALSSLEALATYPLKGPIKFYIYLVSANCIVCVWYFMMADYVNINIEREIDRHRYRYIM